MDPETAKLVIALLIGVIATLSAFLVAAWHGRAAYQRKIAFLSESRQRWINSHGALVKTWTAALDAGELKGAQAMDEALGPMGSPGSESPEDTLLPPLDQTSPSCLDQWPDDTFGPK